MMGKKWHSVDHLFNSILIGMFCVYLSCIAVFKHFYGVLIIFFLIPFMTSQVSITVSQGNLDWPPVLWVNCEYYKVRNKPKNKLTKITHGMVVPCPNIHSWMNE